MRGLQDLGLGFDENSTYGVNLTAINSLDDALSAGLDNLAPLANDLAGATSEGWAFAIDFWPHLCTLFSLLAAMYIVGSNWLNKVRRGAQPILTQPAALFLLLSSELQIPL